jgi:formylglycine-generating enzyme required for sulfatase activity
MSVCGFKRWSAAALLIAGAVLWAQPPAEAASTEAIAERIAQSLINLRGKGSIYKTVAFSQIRTVRRSDIDVSELMDYATTKILQTVLELDVVNRAQLQRILKEQEFQLSDVVSADEYKRLGQLAGVDLFIYGNLYESTLVLKAIDVQNSSIAWAEIFPLDDNLSRRTAIVSRLGEGMVANMKEDTRLNRAGIKTVSFWDFDSNTDITADEVIDILTVLITRDGSFKVVDRQNLRLILGEQSLNQEVYFDQERTARLGGLFGVQAFVNGTLKLDDGKVVADFKMTDIHTGKFVWAAILRIDQRGADEQIGGTDAAGSPDAAPQGMVLVGEGVFIQGTNGSPVEARPALRVTLNAFYIDRHEISNREYAEFVEQRKHRAPPRWTNNQYEPGTGDLPVVLVSWDDARDYCRFVGKRLPTEAEWEKAARGTGGQSYPWSGSSFVAAYAVTRESGKKAPESVFQGGKDVSPYGVLHMAGNVREWVDDVFKPYPGGVGTNAAYNKERVVRGGSYAQTGQTASTFFRGSSKRNVAWPDLGFRCVKSVTGE